MVASCVLRLVSVVMKGLLVAGVFLAGAVQGAEPEVDLHRLKPKDHERNRELAIGRRTEALARFAGREDVLVLPGLVADRTRRRIEVWVERSAVRPGSPCEFLLVGEESDHGYETLLISFAKPSDVHRALEFLGTPAGASYDPESLRFWPKGESFRLSLLRSGKESLPVESLLADRTSGQALPAGRFLFTGARWSTNGVGGQGKAKVYAADEFQPKSVVSLFNTPDAVLQVPQRAPKDEVYQNTVLHPEALPGEHGLLTLLIEPVASAGMRRVKDLTLEARGAGANASAAASDGERLKGLELSLREGDLPLVERGTLTSVLARLAALESKAQDTFLDVRFGDGLPLGHVRALAGVLSVIDSERGVRAEPPAAGQLYYRAFTPDPGLLDREGRLFHPWELVLEHAGGRITGRMVVFDWAGAGQGTHGSYRAVEVPVSGPGEFARAVEAERRRLKERRERARPPVLMVRAPSAMAFQDLMGFVGPVSVSLPMVHVFLDAPAPSLPEVRKVGE